MSAEINDKQWSWAMGLAAIMNVGAAAEALVGYEIWATSPPTSAPVFIFEACRPLIFLYLIYILEDKLNLWTWWHLWNMSAALYLVQTPDNKHVLPTFLLRVDSPSNMTYYFAEWFSSLDFIWWWGLRTHENTSTDASHSLLVLHQDHSWRTFGNGL